MTSVIERPAGSGPGPNPPERMQSSWYLALILGAVAIVVIGFVGLAVGAIALGDRDSSGSASSGPAVTTIDVSLTEFAITGNMTAPEGRVVLRAQNNGSMNHDIAVRELALVSPEVGPGGVVELDLGTLAPGTYEVYCTVAGHEASGMVTTLTIVAEGAEGAVSSGPAQPLVITADGVGAQLDMAMMETMLQFPAETEGRGNEVLEPVEILPDGTKVFELVAAITPWEVEPGKIVDAWSYNGIVPAPHIRLDRGDKVQVNVTNNLPVGTDIHWHGILAPNDQDGVAPYTQDLIPANGGTHTYEFTVYDDAIAMYHAHAHGHHAVVNGMFGAIYVGENPIPYGQTVSGYTIPTDLELAIDNMPMILNDAGAIGLSLNGKSFPATEPIVVKEGDWVSLSYYNEGLQVHPMHLHRFPQLVYAKDGIPLDQPYWVDTLNVAPGERYTVLFRADMAGVWVFHCHILNHVERDTGMFGMVTAVIVEENPDFDIEADPLQPTNWRNTAGAPIGDNVPVVQHTVEED